MLLEIYMNQIFFYLFFFLLIMFLDVLKHFVLNVGHFISLLVAKALMMLFYSRGESFLLSGRQIDQGYMILFQAGTNLTGTGLQLCEATSTSSSSVSCPEFPFVFLRCLLGPLLFDGIPLSPLRQEKTSFHSSAYF